MEGYHFCRSDTIGGVIDLANSAHEQAISEQQWLQAWLNFGNYPAARFDHGWPTVRHVGRSYGTSPPPVSTGPDLPRGRPPPLRRATHHRSPACWPAANASCICSMIAGG